MAITPVKFTPPSDTIHFDKITTGNANAGNGGNGTNNGAITDNAKLYFDPYNEAYGSTVHVNTGDHVHQYASWDAGGANATVGDPPWHITATGGTATSNGSQSSWSGHDTSNVYANTTAHQMNELWADQSQQVYAGNGGGGGGYNAAESGNVDVTSMSLPFDSLS
jgi:hypothetical protein